MPIPPIEKSPETVVEASSHKRLMVLGAQMLENTRASLWRRAAVNGECCLIDSSPFPLPLKAELPTGEQLILDSDQFQWSPEQILEAYKQRWHIERFHRFLKDTLALAHLYNFRQNGINLLIHAALLAALLLFFGDDHPSGDTIVLLRRILRAVRRALRLGTPGNATLSPHAEPKPNPSPNRRKTIKRLWLPACVPCGSSQTNLAPYLSWAVLSRRDEPAVGNGFSLSR